MGIRLGYQIPNFTYGGIIVNLVPNGHEPGVVTMVGEMLGKLLR